MDTSTSRARAAHQSLTGQRGPFARTFFVEAGSPADILAGIVTDRDAVMIPSGFAFGSEIGLTVEYDGEWSAPGDEIHVDGKRLELQDYVAAAFSEVMGATVAAVVDDAGLRALIEDADLARRTGILPAPLVDPRMQLADPSALAAGLRLAMPRCLWLHADGRVTLGARGGTLASAEAGEAVISGVLETPVPGSTALAGVVSAATVEEANARRPWLGRYLRVAELARILQLTLGTDRISGFGWSVIGDDGADADPEADDPILVSAGGEYVLADLTTRRRQRLPEATAVVVEAVQTSQHADRADERIAARLGIRSADARRLAEEAMRELAVHRGARVAAHAAGGAPV